MRDRLGLVCLALMFTASIARGDVPPPPDRGPPTGSAGGLNFAIRPVEVKMPPGYYKTLSSVVLVGCVDGQPNCATARSKSLIGMEVLSVDGQDLQPENGMVQQVLDAFANKNAAPMVTLELYSRASNGAPIKISFARH